MSAEYQNIKNRFEDESVMKKGREEKVAAAEAKKKKQEAYDKRKKDLETKGTAVTNLKKVL